MPQDVNHDLVQRLTERSQLFCHDIIEIVQKVTETHRIENLSMSTANELDDFESRLMYKMLEAAPVFVVELIDGVSDPIIVKATKTVEKMFGYFSGELIDQPISILIPADKREAHRKHIIGLLTNLSERQMGANTLVQPEGIDKNGNRFPIELSWAVEVIHKRRFLIATVMRQLRGQSAGE